MVVRPWLLANASLPDPPPVVATVPLGPAVLAPLVERVEVCSLAELVICSISFDQNRRLVPPVGHEAALRSRLMDTATGKTSRAPAVTYGTIE
jgi:hypothetical protein